MNSYANYFCPKFFSYLDTEERLIFLNILKPYCNLIATSKVGTYPLQNIIELLRDEECVILIDVLKNKILELSMVFYIKKHTG